ncbi:MAG: hypothetical protein WAK33_02980 [Silvibacterium sp.]
MDDSEITNPLAKRLHAKKDAEDVQTGKTLLEKDFISKGKAAAPDQLREIDSKLARYVQDYNAQRPAKAPLLRHVPNRVYADMKFAANFELMPRLEDSHLRVTVGLHSAAAVMMAEIPEVQTTEWWFQAYMDDGGFAWRDGQGRSYDNSQIVDAAMKTLGTLF